MRNEYYFLNNFNENGYEYCQILSNTDAKSDKKSMKIGFEYIHLTIILNFEYGYLHWYLSGYKSDIFGANGYKLSPKWVM